ncbi:MAG: hypothetical protein RIQ54_398 [Candidatus Parcubacteria bacterium]|jgi:hypothetical protein
MNETAIKALLEQAALTLLENQPNLFELTSKTSQTEWNITGRYAAEVHKLFPDYEYDVDLKKPGVQNKRPDIVLHRRGTHDSNFLVIEVKRKQTDVPREIQKIKDSWFPPPLSYKYGSIAVVDGVGSFSVVVLKSETR